MVIQELINNIATNHGDYCVFAGVEERARKGNEFYHKRQESGVIKLTETGEEWSKTVLVYGQVNFEELLAGLFPSINRQNARINQTIS